jgi:hypothetical protein
MGGPPPPAAAAASRLLLPAATTSAALFRPSTSQQLLGRWRVGRPPRLSSSASASSSYNGWGDLPDVSSFPFPFPFPLLLQRNKKKKKNVLLLLILVALPASAVALSRLPSLPLLAASFTAGFAARHLSSPQFSGLNLVLADLDIQVRALRDHLTASSPHSQPLLDAVDRLREAVLHATRLASHDTLGLGDLTDSLAAWARDTMRDLSSSTTRSKPTTHKDLDSPIQQDAAPAHKREPDSIRSHNHDMLPFDNDDDSKAHGSSLGLERMLLKHRREKQTIEIRDRSYRLNIDSESHLSEEAQEQQQVAGPYDAGATTGSEYHEFGRNVKEAADFLKKARDCMIAGTDEETADAFLYKSARLLSTAVALRPTSLVAVGQLGNTYLLHGELKHKISRELRTLLANTGPLLNGRERLPRSRKVDRRMLSRDNISAALVDVCEECESLLIEAGRSYRTALSIDSSDVKALYNWGLALIFRAQLLADIGPVRTPQHFFQQLYL